MIRNVFVLLFVAMALLWSGCYVSDVPMASSENSTIDSRIVGKWSSVDDNIKLTVFKYDDREYFVNYADDQDEYYFRAYMVDVGGVSIMNMQNIADIEENEREFLFVKYEVTEEGGLIAHLVDAESPLLEDRKFDTSADLMKFFQTNMRNDDLYADAIRFKLKER